MSARPREPDLPPCRIQDELRKLPTPALGRLAQPLLDRRRSGDNTPSDDDALRLLGSVLSERKQEPDERTTA